MFGGGIMKGEKRDGYLPAAALGRLNGLVCPRLTDARQCDPL